MNNTKRQTQIGMVLIEAMVALVVMAAGILGVAKLNTFFIQVSGEAKARTQAVQLAEGKLEELRSLMVKTQFTNIAGGSDQPVGHSATDVASTQFQRTWTVTNNGPEGRALTVSVSWVDRIGTTQLVNVRSVIAWNDPAKAIAVVQGNDESGQYAKTPTGRAFLGEGTMDVGDGPDEGGGLRQQQGDDGKWRLVDSTGKVLLTATEENEAFSIIEGNVYIDQQHLDSLSMDNAFVTISDASVCSKVVADPVATLPATGSAIFKYFSYRCYVGAAWYGNVGIVRTDNANANDRVCVGDPNVTPVSYSTDSASRHPALSNARMYRGYHDNGGGNFSSTGIGIDSNGDYTAATYSVQHFLLTRINGNPVDTDCEAKLERFSTANPNVPFANSNGKFVCLSPTCPSPLPAGAAPAISITVEGDIDRGTGQKPSVTSMSIDGGTCQVLGSGNNFGDSYQCTVVLAGWTGSTWDGTMTVTTDGVVCTNGASGAGIPPSGNPAGSGTFTFTNQSVDIATVTQSFKLRNVATACP